MALRRAASRPHAPASSTHSGSSNPTDPPVREPPHPRTRAPRTPRNTKRKGARPRNRQPPTRAPQSARLVAESTRGIVGPAGRRRRRANAAPKPPSDNDAYRAELPPRNLPAGVAIAIGPPRKPGSRARAPSAGAQRRVRVLTAAKSDLRSINSIAITSRARLARLLRPPRAPSKPVLRLSHHPCGSA